MTRSLRQYETGHLKLVPKRRYGQIGTAVFACLLLAALVNAFIHGKIEWNYVGQFLLAPAILERRIGTQYFPEGTHVWGTSNLNEEGLGDMVQAHFRTRVIVVKMRKPTMDEWKNDFAIPNELHPALIAYCTEYPRLFESFTDFLPGGVHAGKDQSKDNPNIYNPRIVQDGYVSPRTLHAASDVLYGCEERGASENALLALLVGAIGEGGAQDLKAYVKAGQSLVPFDRILADPERSPIPTSAVAQIVMVNKFIVQTQTRDHVSAVARYAKRMKTELQTMFVHHVANSPRLPLFASVAEFAPLLKDNRMFLNVK